MKVSVTFLYNNSVTSLSHHFFNINVTFYMTFYMTFFYWFCDVFVTFLSWLRLWNDCAMFFSVILIGAFDLIHFLLFQRLEKWVGSIPSIKWSRGNFLLHYLSMPYINSTLPNTELTSTFEMGQDGGPLIFISKKLKLECVF